MIEPPHLHLMRGEAPESGRDFVLTTLADILLYSWLSDFHCYVNLVGVSPARSD